MPFLSKSDFKAARDCAAKLYFKKEHFPSALDENDFLELLANGGYMVEKLAKLLYPDAIEMTYGGASAEAARATMEALARDRVTLFEATLIAGNKLARADILVKRGNVFELIEVKSKSFDSREPGALRPDGIGQVPRGKRGGIEAEWMPYLEDVAYQALVLRELFPGAEVRPFLMLADKGKTTTIDELHQRFDLRRAVNARGYETVTVEFTGDARDLARIRSGDHFLTLVDVAREETELRASVAAAAAEFAASLQPAPRRIAAEIGAGCHGCEYRAVGDDGRSGFRICWGDAAVPEPHVLDLYNVNRGTMPAYVQELIAAGRCALVDVDERRLVRADGTPGAINARQLVQIRHTREGSEWIGPRLAPELARHAYPLHFIDFEASQLAVPYHAHMRPYEKVAFQWSVHTVERPGAAPVHREWINTESYFPNFTFARTLRDAVGDDGSVFMWHHFERNTVRQIRRQMQERGEDDPALDAWLDALAGRLVDMNAICLADYFHPRMGKSTSIKQVLDAVWSIDPELKREFPEYAAAAGSPYQALPPADIAGVRVEVTEGTAAVRVYEAMLYGPLRHDAAAFARHRDLLRRYCRLDTAAMVMIWRHWERASARLSSASPSSPR